MHHIILFLKFSLIIILVFTQTICTAQNSTLDSLKLFLENTKEDTSRINSFNKIFSIISVSSPDEAMGYAAMALKLSQKNNYAEGSAIALNNIGSAYASKGNYLSAMDYYFKSQAEFEKICSSFDKVAAMRGKKGLSSCLSNFGNVYNYQGNYYQSIVYFQKALKIEQEIDDKKGMATCYSNFGVIYGEQGNYVQALENFNNSLMIFEQLNNKKGIAACYSNLGNVYTSEGQLMKGIYFYQRALRIFQEITNYWGAANCLINIGNIYINQDNYSEGNKYYLKSLKIYEDLGDKNGMALVNINIALQQNRQKLYDKAIKYALKGLQISEEINALPQKKEAYLYLKEAYSGMGDFQKAIKYSDLYIAAKDSLFNKEKNKQIIEVQTKYETEKKINEITLLKKDNEIKKYEINQQKKNIYLIIILSFLILLIILASYNFIRLKQKEKHRNELITQQKTGMLEINVMQENERIRIARDLHDSIGQILAGIKLNFNNFGQEFHPKAINNGDTYNKLSNLIDEACSEVRVISHQMMPKTLIISGLKEAVEEFANKYYSNSGVKFEITVHGLNINDKTIEIQLFRIIQEITSNIIKHAKADNVVIAIVQNKENLSLLIEDNGIGINKSDKENGLGLNNIASRVNSMNGSFVIERNNISQGTIANVKIQLDKIREK